MNKKIKSRKEYTVDVVKDVLQWGVVTAIAFVYWIALLLLGSLFLMNIWHTSFEQILQISLLLTCLTSAGYLGVIIYRKRRG